MSTAARPRPRRTALLAAALVLALGFGALHGARAETADRDKPTQVEADQLDADDLKQVAVYTGNVIVTKGTMRMTGARLELRKDPEGYQYGVMTAAPGQLATFRQRRDPVKPGVEEHVEGYGERIEYDERADNVKLISRAFTRRLENAVPQDELRGDVIVYDQKTARYSVTGGKGAADSNNPDGRVRTIIAPRNEPGAARPAGAPAPLAPAPKIANPRPQ